MPAQRPREATPEEAKAVRDADQRLFGYTINPCHSIPPRHTPYTACDGQTYCTSCGHDITDATGRSIKS